MALFRGDAHKFYLKLKKAAEHGQRIDTLIEMIEIGEIAQFYRSLDSAELNKIRYRMLKEQNGTGMIPVLLSSLPWLLLIFSKQLQSWLFGKVKYLWVVFVVLYAIIIILSIMIHYREKAWASVHVEIIQDILKERESPPAGAT